MASASLFLVALLLPALASAQKTGAIAVIGHDYAFQAPDTVEAGATLFSPQNRGTVRHEVLIILLKVGHALARRAITVNAVSPGWIEDSVLNTLPATVQGLIREWHRRGWTPMRRLGTPADIGNVVGLLCEEEAAWITGQVIYADGGASLMNPEVPPEIQLE